MKEFDLEAAKAGTKERKEITQKVTEIIRRILCIDIVKEESRFKEDLGADSLDEMELKIELSGTFGIEYGYLSDCIERQNVRTVKEIIDIIETKINQV